MKIKTNIRAGISYPPPVSRCVGAGGGGGRNPPPVVNAV